MKHISNNFNIATLFVLFIMCSCNLSSNDQSEKHTNERHHDHKEKDVIELSQKQIETVGIELGHFMKKEIGSTIKVTGVLSVNPQDIAQVTPLLPGILKSINVTEGEKIQAGSIVAKIENIDIITYQKDYQDALEELTLAKSEKIRQEKLAEKGAGIQKNLEQSISNFNIAQTRVKTIENQLKTAGINTDKLAKGEMTRIAVVRAPISGVVNKIFSTIGGFADISNPIMTITNNSRIYATLRIYEKDFNKITKGQKVEMALTNGEGLFEGFIDEINHTIDPDTKGIDIKVKITENKNIDLIPGMAINAYINSGATMSTVLPEGAVISSGGKDFIYVLERKNIEKGNTMYHFNPIEVITGNKQQGFIEIKPINEISEKALIVIDKAFYLASMTADHGEHNH